MSKTRKVVYNNCFGGFSLSPFAVQRMAELQGRPCYFFVHPKGGKHGTDFERYERVTIDEAAKAFMWTAFDVPEAPKTIEGDAWRSATDEERKASNAEYERHEIDNRDIPRDDPLLVRVVEELGEKANGAHAELRIVEIPADVKWYIHEYDGSEHVAEDHRTWG